MDDNTRKAIKTLTPKKNELNILIVGSSWIYYMFPNETGTMKQIEHDFSKKLGKPVHIDIIAKVGAKIDWMLSQTRAHEPKTNQYDSVVFFPGRNDIQAHPAPQIMADIRSFLNEVAKAKVANVVLFNMQYGDEVLFKKHTPRIDEVNRKIDTEIRREYSKVHVFDIYALSKSLDLGKRLHPPDSAYPILRDNFCDFFARSLALVGTVDKRKSEADKSALRVIR